MPKRYFAVRQPLEQQPRVDEVEVCARERFSNDVVLNHAGTSLRGSCQQRRVQINRNELPGRADRLDEPARHRSSTGADIEAPPTRADAPLSERLQSGWVKGQL